MGDRTCDRCNKVFTKPFYLQRHLVRKTPCAPILEPEDLPPETLEDPHINQKKCRFCGRAFSSSDNMRRHVRTNCKIVPNEKNGDEGMERLYEHTIQKQQAQIDTMQALMVQQAEMITRLIGPNNDQLAAPRGQNGGNTGAQAGEVTVQGVQGDVAIDNSKRMFTTVNINVFGQESLDHVTMERIKAVLDESIRAPALLVAANTAILKTAMLVYSDPDRPENLTCYLPNKKTNDALVHLSRPDGTTGWEVRPTTLVLPPMAQKSVDMLFDRQPFEDAEEYAPLMKDLRDNEARYTAGGELRPILVRNKELLARALESLPIGGTL